MAICMTSQHTCNGTYYPLHLAYTVTVWWRCKLSYKIIYYSSLAHPKLTHIFKTIWYATWDYSTSLSISCWVFFSGWIVSTTIFSSASCSCHSNCHFIIHFSNTQDFHLKNNFLLVHHPLLFSSTENQLVDFLEFFTLPSNLAKIFQK